MWELIGGHPVEGEGRWGVPVHPVKQVRIVGEREGAGAHGSWRIGMVGEYSTQREEGRRPKGAGPWDWFCLTRSVRM